MKYKFLLCIFSVFLQIEYSHAEEKSCQSWIEILVEKNHKLVSLAKQWAKSLFGRELSPEEIEMMQHSLLYSDRKNSTDRRYQIHNKEIPPKTKLDKVSPLVRIVDKSILYFIDTIFQKLETRTGIIDTDSTLKKKVRNGDADSVPLEAINLSKGLLIPSTYQLHPSAQNITEDGAGNWRTEGTIDRTVPLMKRRTEALTFAEKKVYQHKESIALKEWPQWIQDLILDLKKKQKEANLSDLQIAFQITEAIKTKFKYSKTKSAAFGLIQIAHLGELQCDAAAGIAVSILRNYFSISSRVVSGYRATKDPSNDEMKMVYDGAEAHAWMQVFDSERGLWIDLDPTPGGGDSGDGDDENGEAKPDDSKTEKKESDDSPPEPPPENEKSKAPPPKEVFDWKKEWKKAFSQWPDYRQLIQRLHHLGSHPETPDKVKDSIDKWTKILNSWLGYDAFTTGLSSIEDGGQPEGFMDQAIIFDSVYRERKELALTNSDEDRFNFFVNRLMATASLQDRPWMDSWGPISKNILASRFRESSGWRAQALAKAIRAGNIDRLFDAENLKSIMDVWLAQTPLRGRVSTWSGRTSWAGSEDLVIDGVTDLATDAPYLRMDAPPDMEILNALQREALTMKFPVNDELREERGTDEGAISLILRDISISMRSGNRWRARDAALVNLLNQYFSPKRHPFSIIDFDHEARDPLELRTREQVREFVEQLLFRTSSEDGGTNIGVAIKKAIQSASAILKKNLKNRAVINLIILTDGEDEINISSILDDIKALPKGSKFNIIAVSFESGNIMLKSLTDTITAAPKGRGIVKPVHQHLNAETITKITRLQEQKDKALKDLVENQKFNADALSTSEWQSLIEIASSLYK